MYIYILCDQSTKFGIRNCTIYTCVYKKTLLLMCDALSNIHRSITLKKNPNSNLCQNSKYEKVGIYSGQALHTGPFVTQF